MKKLSIIFSAFLLITMGCAKELEIQPAQSVDEELVFNSDANIKAALTGAYDVATGGSLYGGDLQMFSELLAAGDEISWVGTYNEPDEVYTKSILTNNDFVLATYSEAYNAINICNNIIASIDIVNEDDRDYVKGQALFLRGAMYFALVKLYALPYSAGNTSTNPGLQMITAPTLDGNTDGADQLARSSVEETYAQIVSDLTAAKAIIGGDVGEYASEYAVSAMLSRVYLQMGNYEGARDEANNVIENSGASLEGDYILAFNNTAPSSEDIWVIPITAQDGVNDFHVFWSIPDYGARDGDIEINQEHIDLYEAGDTRAQLFYMANGGIWYSGKWQLQYKYIPVIRLAEMYLTRAEANFMLGTSIGATPDEDLNGAIRSRAGLSPVTVSLENIIYERRLELAHEGHRMQDIKRLKESIDGYDYDANELVFPIPLREMNASNGGLVQNEGY